MPEATAVLFVGSDPDVCQRLRAVFSPSEWRLEHVGDGLQAISLLEARRFDIAVIDPAVAGIGGVELLRRARQIQPATRVIVMTAGRTPLDVIHSIREHAFSHFSEPLDTEAVVYMIVRAAAAVNWEDGIEVLSALPEWISLRLRCRMITADRLVQFFGEIRMELPEQDRAAVATAFREMLLNAIEHGGRFDPNQTVNVSRFRLNRAVIYLIQDPGEGFSFGALPHAAVSNSPDSPAEHMVYRGRIGMRPGGFGLLMARNLVDELIHNEKGNEVLFIKYLET